MWLLMMLLTLETVDNVMLLDEKYHITIVKGLNVVFKTKLVHWLLGIRSFACVMTLTQNRAVITFIEYRT